jgi:hypothetical protein
VIFCYTNLIDDLENDYLVCHLKARVRLLIIFVEFMRLMPDIARSIKWALALAADKMLSKLQIQLVFLNIFGTVDNRREVSAIYMLYVTIIHFDCNFEKQLLCKFSY